MRWPLGLLAVVLAVCAATPVSATTITLDTTSLVTGSTGPYYLEFQLVDGDGLPNNTVTLSGFNFGAGGVAGAPMLIGGANGDAATSVMLDDSSFFNEFIQQFTPGDLLSFSFDVTTNLVSATPDRFTFAILNSSLFEVPTLGAGNEVVGVNLQSPLVIETYAGIAGGQDPVLPTPQINVVPEPTTLVLVTTGVALIAARRRVGYRP